MCQHLFTLCLKMSICRKTYVTKCDYISRYIVNTSYSLNSEVSRACCLCFLLPYVIFKRFGCPFSPISISLMSIFATYGKHRNNIVQTSWLTTASDGRLLNLSEASCAPDTKLIRKLGMDRIMYKHAYRAPEKPRLHVLYSEWLLEGASIWRAARLREI
jgi:hypothetical protein